MYHKFIFAMEKSSFLVYNSTLPCKLRRDGRAVEGAALEMLFRGDFNEGSNPSLSALKAN